MDRESAVDPRFGRARWFLVYDDGNGELEVLDNEPSQTMAHGAGIQTAKRVIDRGAEVVVTGRCGPKAFDTLAAGKVRVFVGATGTVGEAITAFERGDLETASGPNGMGHGGF